MDHYSNGNLSFSSHGSILAQFKPVKTIHHSIKPAPVYSK